MQEQNTPALLIVDDDETFCQVLSRAFERRGFACHVAHDTEAGAKLAKSVTPSHAILDLRMPGHSGLELIPSLLTFLHQSELLVFRGSQRSLFYFPFGQPFAFL